MGLIISSVFGVIIWILELYAAFTDRAKLRKIVKPFCLISLILVVFFLKYHSPLLLVALGFGLLGDLLLIKDDSKVFYALGGAAFWVNHVLFIYLFNLENPRKAPIWLICILIAVVSIIVFFINRFLSKYMGKLSVPCALYYFILLMEGVFSALLFIGRPSVFSAIIWLGSFSFLVSDIILITGGFVKKINKKDFYVMLLYVLGQVLMSVGLCLLTKV